jgi:transcriptional regulator of acetoin/glycerol metabolism
MREQTGDLLTAMAGSQTLAADILRASWSRCLSEYKLDRALRKPIARISDSTVRELRSEMEEVLVESSPIVDRVRRVARDANYVVLFSDANGVVIESHADSAEGQEVAMEGLVKGSVWRENLVGTNGIGTCLISRNPITVNGTAHFNETFRNYTCSAAPIHGPDGRIVAVLDISGRATLDASSYNFAQHFTREAASQIGILLFRKWHKNDCIIALSDQPDPMPLGLKALVATDERGRILGATQEALNQLGVPELSDLGGRSISDLWHVSLDDLKPLHSHNVRLNMNNGFSTYATAFLPRRKSVSAPARAPRPSDKRASNGSSAMPLDRIAGADPQVIQCVELCRKIIDKDIPLLILGETGSGKDTLARAIHDESERADKPFVAVNCAAIPATLLASELFGYAPGTFTGGVKGGRIGKIAASHGGTLFLDEIGDMPLELQAHLLRVLEERSVTPLGSTESVPVDMKIICATHRNLTELVAKGSFRKDLYYRIKGVQITLPNLSQRTDLAEIAQKIAEEELGDNRSGFAFSDEVLALFRRYPWPGNVRELKSVIRFITSIHGAKLITLEHLPEGLIDMTRSAPEAAARVPISTFIPERREDGTTLSGSGQTLVEANEAGEKKRIVEALRASKWNVTEAASQLGVSRATLHRKIRKYRIMSPNNLG